MVVALDRPPCGYGIIMVLEEKEYQHKYYLVNKERLLEKHRAYNKANKDMLKDKTKEWRKAHPEEYKAQNRVKTNRRRARIKGEVLTYYSKGMCECVRCCFSDIRALSIDHINGGGRKHLRSIGIKEGSLYEWLKRKSYPEGYQTLCMNCQFIKSSENKEYG